MNRNLENAIAWLGRAWLVHAPTERGKSFVMREVFPRLAPEAADFNARAPGGGIVRARLTESTGWALLHGWDVEHAEMAWAVERVGSGETVVDAGANVGLFTIPVARAVGPTGRVIAIEPFAGSVERLRAGVALNRLANVQIEQVALGESSGPVEFFVAEDSAYSGLEPDERSPTAATATVEMTTLDEVWTAAGRPPVTLVKLDVEGAEARALAGAEGLLTGCRPTLLIEAGDADRVAALGEWLGSRGYREQTPAGFRPYNHVFEA